MSQPNQIMHWWVSNLTRYHFTNFILSIARTLLLTWSEGTKGISCLNSHYSIIHRTIILCQSDKKKYHTLTPVHTKKILHTIKSMGETRKWIWLWFWWYLMRGAYFYMNVNLPKSPQFYLVLIVKSPPNPFLEPTSTKQWE